MTQAYGDGDTSYRAAGGEEGIRKLVDRFYDHMDSEAVARAIRAMHPRDLTVSRDKLTLFLCGWLGGPRLFAEKYPTTPIPRFHAQFDIDEAARDAWLHCMQLAVDEQDYEPDFKQYLIEQLFIPAERSRAASQARRDAE